MIEIEKKTHHLRQNLSFFWTKFLKGCLLDRVIHVYFSKFGNLRESAFVKIAKRSLKFELQIAFIPNMFQTFFFFFNRLTYEL